MRQRIFRTAASLAVVVLFCATPMVAATDEPIELGRLYLKIDGNPVPNLAGDPVFAAPQLVRTLTHPAQVRLFNGAVLEFEANSAASLAAVEGDAVQATVLSGAIEMRDKYGRSRRAGTRSVFLVTPVEPDTPPSDSELSRIEQELEHDKNDDGVHQRRWQRRTRAAGTEIPRGRQN